ncbi:MAG: sugar O-acetyltransferase [Succinivibrionaceae bacterium]
MEIMSEKDKMINHKLYDANYDRDLENERIRCKQQCQKYNNLPIENLDERHQMLKSILGKTGLNVHIEPNFWCDYGYRIEVGENFYANHGLVILDAGGVTIGDNVFVGPSCGFHTSGHPIDFERRNKGLEYAYPIKIGSNVWIGAGVQVMPGVTIGDNVVIGGGSVVVKDIPSNSVAVGNPCKVLRKITEDDQNTCWDR